MNKPTLLKAIKSSLLLMILLVAGDRTIGYVLERMYFKQKKGDFFQTTYAIKNAKEDVLIFGSSRAMHHYISDIFERKFQLSTYNLGRNGRNILYSHAIFSHILTHHKPKIVILDVQQTEFTWKAGKEGEDAMISSLLPYSDSPAIRKSISRIRKSDLILSEIFKTYPYNSNVAQILGYYYGFMSDSKNFKGYVPLKGNKATRENRPAAEQGSIKNSDTTLVNTFKDFLALAKAHNIKLYIIVSPTTRKLTHSSIAEIKRIAKQAGVNFYDFSNIETFKNYTLFYDNTHLNDKGAAVFTEEVANELSKSIDFETDLTETLRTQNAVYR